MQFKDFEYKRPDLTTYTNQVESLVTRLENCEETQAIEILNEYFQLGKTISTMQNLANIRNSIDTRDEFYKQEDDFWNEYGPLFASADNKMVSTILNSKHLAFLKTKFPKTYFLSLENAQKAFSEEVIPLLQLEGKLSSQYEQLVASAQIEFEGNTYTLAQLGPFVESLDRETRKKASKASAGFYAQHEKEFDEIYDQLVKTRHEIAVKLGFKNFVELGYVRMNRFDYDASMVDVYRKEVIKHVVPVVQELRQRQAKRLGLTHLKHYDLPLSYLSGNATPQISADEIMKAGHKMYQELSSETCEFIDFMFEKDLFDVLSKPGKRSGGYCTFIPEYKAPFIFANFNKTSHDIDVLTHEAGHAFQVYRSRDILPLDVLWPTYETCEIHSMSMEFITWPWMENYFKHQTEKYKYSHLCAGLIFLPYGVCVDHFQHEVYSNPNLTPDERKAVWKKLEEIYLPDRDYSEDEYLNKGTVWMRQIHIFTSPFYYIDYTLAQICAYQFWKRTQVDKDATAWKDYLAICDCGGTKSFLEVVKLANLFSPFEEGALTSTIQSIKQYLENVDDSKF